MDERMLTKENIKFADDLHRTFDLIPKDALFVVDRKLFERSYHMQTFLEDARVHFFEASEENKTLSEVEKIYDFLLLHHKNQILVAIGGGITGDTAGFAAATFKRGIPFVLVPTTLLSMCDSAVGGKCGVNYKGIKNYIGAFKKPDRILICTQFLQTLEERELKSGLGEIIKYGLLGDEAILRDLLLNSRELKELPFESYIRSGLLLKAKIVEEDFRDEGIRNSLNLGHNIGHAIESTHPGKVSHGEAVALGLIVELTLSMMKYGSDAKIRDTVISIMSKYGMQTKLQETDLKAFMMAIKKDKKNDEYMRFTLLKKIGEPIIKVKVEENEILQAMTMILE